MIDTNKYDTNQIKFSWDISFVISDTGKGFRPRNLISVQKINDYEKNFFPIFRLELQFENKYFDLIFKTQSRLLCKIILKRLFFSNNFNDDDSDKTLAIKEEIAMQDSFVAFFSKIPNDLVPSDQLVNENNLDKDYKPDDDNIAASSVTTTTVYLFHLDSLKSFKLIYNKVFENANVGTALGYIIQNCNLVKKAIVDIPDNTVKYENLILLPYGLKNSILSLQLRYGIYANGLINFLDNGVLYCLKALSDEHQYEKDKTGYCRIMMRQTPNSIVYPFVTGINKEDKSLIFESDSPLLKQNYDVIMGEILGDSVVYSNFDHILSSIEGNGDNLTIKSTTAEITRGKRSHIDTGIKLDIDYDELNNPYNMLANIRKENSNMAVPITIKGCDIDSFSPEKRVILEIDDVGKTLEYGGSYCIRNVVYVFAPDKNVDKRFETTCLARVSLSKVPEDLK